MPIIMEIQPKEEVENIWMGSTWVTIFGVNHSIPLWRLVLGDINPNQESQQDLNHKAYPHKQ